MTSGRLSPEAVHQRLFRTVKPALGFDPTIALTAQRPRLLRRLVELLAIPEGLPDPPLRVEHERRIDGMIERRFLVTAEPCADVPCHLLLPEGATGRLPVFLCLQGHTTGMHLSLGRAGDGNGRIQVVGDRDFALQAVRHGYAAVTIELRGFGERRDRRPASQRDEKFSPESLDPDTTCKHAAMTALLLGRTSLGEKLLDLRQVLQALEAFPEVDASEAYCIGNSGGGTLGWYAAAVEPKIRGAVLGSCLATYAGSIGAIDHCCDNYIPGALRWFEMADLAMLIAPKPLVVVMGENDPIFPQGAILPAFERTRAIYEAANAADRCALELCKGGHRFYADQAWRAFGRVKNPPAASEPGADR